MKIELFSRMVIEKNLSEDRRILEALNRKHAKVLDDMESRCQKQREAYLENIEEKASDRKRRILSKAHSEAQNRLLVKKNEMVGVMKRELMDALEKETMTDAYKSYFNKRLAEALSNFVEKDDLVIGVKARDFILVKDDIETTIDEKILGGFYIIKGGRIKYDYTLNSEVNRMDEFLGLMIETLYESSEEDSHEDE
jgi:vacuolar-type H+-ATPase subunit E/Vma4